MGQKLIMNFMRNSTEVILEWIDKVGDKKNYSYPENYLANILRMRNIKHARQYAIGNLHVDFYFSEHNLVLEIDGKEWHKTTEQKIRDDKRDKFLISKGFTVFRISAVLALEYTDAVLSFIKFIPKNKCIQIEKESDVANLIRIISKQI